jgi:hypothetical protein
MGLATQWFGGAANRRRIEPRFEAAAGKPEGLDAARDDGAPTEDAEAPVRGDRLKELSRRYDVRAISPREMVSLSLDLYVAGFLTKDQYAELAFQPELLPSFDRTIGALTGEPAAPDRRRDFTEVWRQRLAFEARHFADEPRVIARTRKILDLLKSI